MERPMFPLGCLHDWGIVPLNLFLLHPQILHDLFKLLLLGLQHLVEALQGLGEKNWVHLVSKGLKSSPFVRLTHTCLCFIQIAGRFTFSQETAQEGS